MHAACSHRQFEHPSRQCTKIPFLMMPRGPQTRRRATDNRQHQAPHHSSRASMRADTTASANLRSEQTLVPTPSWPAESLPEFSALMEIIHTQVRAKLMAHSQRVAQQLTTTLPTSTDSTLLQPSANALPTIMLCLPFQVLKCIITALAICMT